MYKYITCPECGTRICRADYGSKIEIPCTKCKAEIVAKVSNLGIVQLSTNNEQTILQQQVLIKQS